MHFHHKFSLPQYVGYVDLLPLWAWVPADDVDDLIVVEVQLQEAGLQGENCAFVDEVVGGGDEERGRGEVLGEVEAAAGGGEGELEAVAVEGPQIQCDHENGGVI